MKNVLVIMLLSIVMMGIARADGTSCLDDTFNQWNLSDRILVLSNKCLDDNICNDFDKLKDYEMDIGYKVMDSCTPLQSVKISMKYPTKFQQYIKNQSNILSNKQIKQ